MITQSPFVFAGSQPDLALTLSDSATLPNYAMRPSGSNYGQIGTVVRKIASKTLTSIGEYGFYDFKVLEEIDLPNVTTIGSAAFTGSSSSSLSASSITVLTLPKVQTIDTYAFRYRTSLQTVTLGSPSNPVTSIASTAFQGCTQSGLTINIYTTGGAALSNSPFGATNAAVNYIEA